MKNARNTITRYKGSSQGLEGETYATDSLMIPLINELRNGLEKSTDRYSPQDIPEEVQISMCKRQERAVMRPCVTTLLRDTNERWGDGKDRCRQPAASIRSRRS